MTRPVEELYHLDHFSRRTQHLAYLKTIINNTKFIYCYNYLLFLLKSYSSKQFVTDMTTVKFLACLKSFFFSRRSELCITWSDNATNCRVIFAFLKLMYQFCICLKHCDLLLEKITMEFHTPVCPHIFRQRKSNIKIMIRILLKITETSI